MTASVGLIALLLVGCSSTGTSSQPLRCEPAAPAPLEAISTGLTATGGGTLRDGMMLKSNDFSHVYFVAAEIDGSGIEGDGEVTVWSTNDASGGGGLIFAVNGLAKEFSDWGPGDETDANITMSDDGAAEARDCAS